MTRTDPQELPMPLVVAMSEIPANKVNQPGRNMPGAPGAMSTGFFRATADAPDAPTAALNRYEGRKISNAHFHDVDQFQVIVEGSGDFGRHPVKPYYVHFSRAHTPYGPLQSKPDSGWGFIVLRARFDPGAQRFPWALAKLKEIAGRHAWQVTTKVDSPGCEAIIMNFPKPGPRMEDKAPEPAAAYKTLQCVLCAFVYDEEAGLPEEGIAPGTRWEDVPENWNCPDCSATKKDFVMVEI